MKQTLCVVALVLSTIVLLFVSSTLIPFIITHV